MIKDLDIIVNRIGHINKCLGEVIRSSEFSSKNGLGHHDLDIEVLRYNCKLLLRDINLVFGEDDEY